jgi:hypothetical protein
MADIKTFLKKYSSIPNAFIDDFLIHKCRNMLGIKNEEEQAP